jgi:3',5'-nucleoside bisphosphate phosphatase
LRTDLHIHSTASDGSLSPGAVVEAARAGRLSVIAIADHDTVAGVLPAQQAGTSSVHVIPAIEVSTRHQGAELHVLGYYVDTAEPALASFVTGASTRREQRIHEMIALLERVGVRVRFSDVLAAAGSRPDSIGRPHLARAIVQKGYAATVSDVFDRYLGDDGPAFVPTTVLTPAEAIRIIHGAGGVAVWAHPRLDALESGIGGLVGAGLDGIECFRPRNTPAEAEHIARVAATHGLFVTGGSDWHGEWQGPLGDFAVDGDDIAAFLDIGGF